ncbi:MAG: cation diffusion facilitator family transporter [Candidatus Obscuribacterales bacterium]|nr:cation diffusion facilitator family transporter [Candidatus Obscuribacterales bacterium]
MSEHSNCNHQTDAGGHSHSHFEVREKNRGRLILVLCLTGTFMLVEAAAGIYTGSLALIADAGHMLGDVAALALALFAFWLSAQPAGPSRTFGYHRSEILAALANSVLMVMVSLVVLFEACQRMAQPPEVQSGPMLIVAFVGLLLNLVSMRLLSSSAEQSLNAKAAYLEVFSDMLASVGVVVAGLIMMFTGWYLADPLLSAVLSVFIVLRTWGLLKESVDILMESAPAHVDLSELNDALLKIEGVSAIHDLHVWTITSGVISMSGHVNIGEGADSDLILDQVKEVLEHRFNITHTTIQIETEKSRRRCNDICLVL